MRSLIKRLMMLISPPSKRKQGLAGQSKYERHQGSQEIERRRRQIERGVICVNS